MNSINFNELVENRIKKIQETLKRKASEYATNDDRLYNFKRAAEILQTTPQKALLGMMMKHWVSVLDLIESRLPFNIEILDEKIGDSVNYLILLEAILKEHFLDV